MSRALALLILAALAACSSTTEPAKPSGPMIPVNAALWDYHGNDIAPRNAR